jgi:hypothetical protein
MESYRLTTYINPTMSFNDGTSGLFARNHVNNKHDIREQYRCIVNL